jgi:hypothetical protein
LPDCERTDRDRRDQLHKTEETYTGALIEITVVRNPARMTRTFYAQAARQGSSAEHRPGWQGHDQPQQAGPAGQQVQQHGEPDPARSARASAIAVSARAGGGVRRWRRAVSPSTCSANVFFGQSGLPHKNRRIGYLPVGDRVWQFVEP